MSTESKHTLWSEDPITPWTQDAAEEPYWPIILRDAGGHWVLQLGLDDTPVEDHNRRQRNIARKILRAVNCHEDLVKALEPFAALLQDHHEQMPDTHVLFAVNRVAITFGQLRDAVAVLARAKAAP